MSREEIADAVLAAGFDDLTVSGIATRLGVGHSSLYRHVSGRDDLVLAAFERLVATTRWPEPTEDWRDSLEREALTLWGMLQDNSGLTAELLALPTMPTGIVRHFGRVIGRLVELGFAPLDAFLAADSVFDLAVDASLRTRQVDRLATSSWRNAFPSELRPLLDSALDDPQLDWFLRKLELVLDGIGLRLAPGTGADHRTAPAVAGSRSASRRG